MVKVFQWQDIDLLPRQLVCVEAYSLEEAILILSFRASYNVMQMPEDERFDFFNRLTDELTQKTPEEIPFDVYQSAIAQLKADTKRKR